MGEPRSRAETQLIAEGQKQLRAIESELLELKIQLAALEKDRARLDAFEKLVASRGPRGLRVACRPDELRELLDQAIVAGEWPQPERR